MLSIYRGVEQLAARWAHNPKVAGSSPAPATSAKQDLLWPCFFVEKNKCLLWSVSHITPQNFILNFCGDPENPEIIGIHTNLKILRF